MSNISSLIESRLASDIVASLRAVAMVAEEYETKPYLVGGLVRDLIVGASASPDLDIALVGATADTFDDIARRVSGEITKRSQFNTVSMKVGPSRFDIIMARSESYPTPGSLPVVRPGSILEDLARRDFSVNAMAASLSETNWGNLTDPQGGLADLREGTLRMLQPNSFQDDATRILRAARYSSRLALALSPETERALLQSVECLRRISPARTRNELERVFLEKNAAAALGLLHEWRALTAIHPSLRYNAPAWKLFDERARSLPERERVAVGYAIFGSGVSKTESDAILSRLRPGYSERRALRESASLSEMISDGALDGMSNSELSQTLDPLSDNGIIGCSLTIATNPLAKRLEEYLHCLKTIKPILKGNDIIALGVERGPDVGKTLARLRAAKQDGLLKNKAEEEAFVLARLKASRER